MYLLKLKSKLPVSVISDVIPHASNPTIIPIANINTIIELVFLFNFVFLIINLIKGSSIKEIINAIKKGI